MKQRHIVAASLLSLSTLTLAGCEQMADSVSDAFQQQSGPSGAPDRVQQQLGNGPLATDTAAAARLSGSFRAAAAQALPAVVQITTIAMSERSMPLLPGFPLDGEPRAMQGTGSGFFIDDQGHILTNHHVVRNALNVNVVLLDGREFTAQVIGSDPNSDVAVIKVDSEGEELPMSVLGESETLRVGDWVLALGNPLGLTFTATAGIVSAKSRNIGILEQSSGALALESFIQTDAAINPGNSGGPLVDLNGRVVGINTAIESATGFFTGAGFAIPIDLAAKFANDIIMHGAVHRPRLGVQIQDVNAADAEVYSLPSVSGVEVVSVTPGTPADRAGLELGDVIVSLDDTPVNTVAELQARVARFQPGDAIAVDFIRYGVPREATVTLGEFETALASERRSEDHVRTANPLGFNITQLPPQMASRVSLRGDDIPVVAEVDPLGPASSAGLRRGHVIRQFNGRDIRTTRDLERAASGIRSGDVVSLVVLDVAAEEPAPVIFNYRAQ
ncbi:MAG: trypsin-like peptidase domain-containing protein [Gemmatimonadota bacterium]